MDGVQWLILVVVVVVAVIAYRRSVQTCERRDQSRQITAHARGPARSPTEEISQREDRRVAGMTAATARPAQHRRRD